MKLPFRRESYSEQNDAEGVSLEESPGEDGFDLRQRVAEDQGRFGQVPPAEPQRRQQEPHTERDRSMNELWCSSPMLLKNKNEWILCHANIVMQRKKEKEKNTSISLRPAMSKSPKNDNPFQRIISSCISTISSPMCQQLVPDFNACCQHQDTKKSVYNIQ